VKIRKAINIVAVTLKNTLPREAAPERKINSFQNEP